MIIKRITGIIEDGSNSSPILPSNPRVTLRIPIRSNVRIIASIYYRSGAPFEFESANDSIYFTVRQKPGGIKYLNIAGNLLESSNVFNFDIAPNDTKDIFISKAFYDIFLNDNNDIMPVMPISPIIFENVVSNISIP